MASHLPRPICALEINQAKQVGGPGNRAIARTPSGLMFGKGSERHTQALPCCCCYRLSVVMEAVVLPKAFKEGGLDPFLGLRCLSMAVSAACWVDGSWGGGGG